MSSPLLLRMAPEGVLGDEVDKPLPCHVLVIEPLLRVASAVQIVGGVRSPLEAPDTSKTPNARWVHDFRGSGMRGAGLGARL